MSVHPPIPLIATSLCIIHLVDQLFYYACKMQKILKKVVHYAKAVLNNHHTISRKHHRDAVLLF